MGKFIHDCSVVLFMQRRSEQNLTCKTKLDRRHSMFESLPAHLRKYKCDPICVIWTMYFTKSEKVPKNIDEVVPGIASRRQLFDRPLADRSAIKKQVMKLKDPDEIYTVIHSALPLQEPLNQEFIDVARLPVDWKTLPKAASNYIFRSMIRFFCQFTDQICSILPKALAGDQATLDLLLGLRDLILFFTNFSGELFEHFMTVLKPMIAGFSRYWDEMISTQNTQLVTCCLGFIVGLVSCVQVGQGPMSPMEASCIQFIVEQLYRIFGLLQGDLFTVEVAREIRIVLEKVLLVVDKIPEKGKADLSCAAIHLLNKICACDFEPMDIYQLGSTCIRVYSDCSRDLSDRLASHQFDVIIEFVTWAIGHFANESFSKQEAFPMKKSSFSFFTDAVKLSHYLAMQPGLRQIVEFDFCEQLKCLADEVNQICTKYRNRPYIMSLMINALKKQTTDFDSDRYRTYIAFMIQVIGSSDLGAVCEAFGKDWSVLLCEYLYPFDPWELDDHVLRDSVNYFLYRCYRDVDNARPSIIDSMYEYVQKSGNIEAVYHFWPIFNQLLRDASTLPFISMLMQSRLLSCLLELGKTDLTVFDFIRMCAFIDSSSCFQSDPVMDFMIESFFDPERRSSVICCFANDLNLGKKTAEFEKSQMNTLQSICRIIQRCIDEDNSVAVNLFPILESCASRFTEPVVEFCQKIDMFDVIAKLALKFDSAFYINCVKLLSTLTHQNSSILKLLSSKEMTFYDVLGSGIARLGVTTEIVDVFLDMALVKRAGTTHALIDNYRAIELLLAYGRLSDDEEQVVEKLLDLASHPPNITELNNGNIIQLILSRIKEVQHNSKMRLLYQKLFQALCTGMFTVSTFYKTVELVKEEDFLYPDEILGILRDIFATSQSSLPSTYFVFDGHESGIFPPPVNVGDSFTFCASIKPELSTTLTQPPILTLIAGDGETTCFSFKQGQVNVKKGTADLGEFPFVFQTDAWYFVTLTVSSHGFTLAVDSQVLKIDAPVRIVNPVRFLIAARSSDKGIRNLAAEMSTIFIFKTSDTKLIKPGMKLNSLPSSLSSSLLFCLDPTKSQNLQILNASPSVPTVDFKGKCVLFASTIHDILPSTAALSNLLPLFTRVFGNQLPVETGKNFLSILFGFIGKIMTLSESSQKMFLSIHGFELLASFLDATNEIYFGLSLLRDLLSLFHSLTVFELKVRMVESIWLNFDLSRKFMDLQQIYFSSSALLAYQEDHDGVFSTVGSLDFSIYQAMVLFPEECDSGVDCWEFIRKSTTDFLDPNIVLTLLTAAIAHKSVFSTNQAILSVKRVSPEIQIADPRDLKETYLSLVVCLQYPEVWNQVFAIMDKVHGNNPSPDYGESLTNATEVFNPEDKDFGEAIIASHLYDMSGAVVRPQYLPLYLKCVTQMNFERRAELIGKLTLSLTNFPDKVGNIGAMKHWYTSLFCLAESMDGQEQEFGPLYSHIIDSSLRETKSNETLVEFFDFLSIHDGNYRWLKKRILLVLISLTSKDCATFELLIEPVFEYLFFRPVCDSTKYPCLLVDLNPENGEWCDMDVSVGLLDLYDPEKQLENSRHMLMLAYMTAMEIRYNNNQHVKAIENARCDQMVKYQALSILVHSSRMTFEELFPTWVKVFDDPFDSCEFQYFEFEVQVSESMKSRLESVTRLKQEIEDRKRGFSEAFAEQRQRIELNAKRFVERQQLRLDGNRENRAKLRVWFMNSFCTGPWSKQCETPRFRFSSYIGNHGQRSILLVNRNYTSHADASHRRDNVESEPKESEDVKAFFKPLSRIQETDLKSGFWVAARLVSITGVYEGILSVKRQFVLFDGKSIHDKRKRIEVDMGDIEFIFNKLLAGDDVACEIFTSYQKSYFLVFAEGQRSKFYDEVSKFQSSTARVTTKKSFKKFNFFARLRKVCGKIYQTIPAASLVSKLKLTELWQSYRLSTYAYLYYLNIIAGRSFNSFSQYPIYPWLIRETQNNTLNLLDANIYRDLSVSAPALSEHRKEKASATYHQLPGELAEEDCQWCFHYLPGAHVFEYLIRFEPFVTQHIILQNNCFDHPDRLFFSIPVLWDALYGFGSTGKECIPEFYTSPSFLKNENEYDLGVLDGDAGKVDDVVLPLWAQNNHHYIAMNRIALEGRYVSENIHKWIDLIFGVYRCDEAHWTVFHPFFYPDKQTKPENMQKKRDMMLQFGSIPMQLFTSEHPKRGVPRPVKLIQSVSIGELTVARIRKQVILCHPPTLIDARKTGISKRELPKNGYGQMWAVSRSLGLVVFGTGADMFVTVYDLSNGSVRTASHGLSLITCATVIGGKILLTGGNDGSLRVWKLPEIELLSVSTFHCEPLTAISGCADIGLCVSVDTENNMIFETLFMHEFIRIVKLDSIPNTVPRLSVFKSGSVVVADRTERGSELKLFDVRGGLLKTVDLQCLVVETDKYYDFDTREFLFVSNEHGTIEMYDVMTMEAVYCDENERQKRMFCTVKEGQAILFDGGNKVISQSFKSSL